MIEQGIISEIELPYNDQQEETAQDMETKETLNNLITEMINFETETTQQTQTQQTKTSKQHNKTVNNLFTEMIDKGIISEIEIPHNNQEEETTQHTQTPETINSIITQITNLQLETTTQTQHI